MPPGPRGTSTYEFRASKEAMGRYEYDGDTYIRMPGRARFQQLDMYYSPEMNPVDEGVHSGAFRAQYWTAPLYMTLNTFNYWKDRINDPNSGQKTWPDPMAINNRELYFIEINGPTFGYFDQLSIEIWKDNITHLDLPFNSDLVSATIQLNALTGVNFGVPAISQGGMTPPAAPSYTGTQPPIGLGPEGTSLSAEERRMINLLSSTNNPFSTEALPSTVFIQIPSSSSGVVPTIVEVKLPPNTKPNNFLLIRQQIRQALAKTGYTPAMIELFFKNNPQIHRKLIILPNSFGANGNTTGATSGGSRGSRNNKDPKVVSFGSTPQPDFYKKVVVRFGASYALPQGIPADDSRPLMIQWMTNSPIRTATDFLNGKSTREEDRIITDPATGRIIRWTTQQATLKYVFPYVPTDIQYSTLGAQWTEVPRSKNVPFVDFQGFQRMKVSFSFIISGTRTEPGGRVVPDGLYSSVDEQITLLRKMYQSKQPVTIYNMDGLLTNPENRLNNNPVQFVISDMNIEAIRRQESSPSRITTAQCSITLSEIVAENAVLVNIRPPIFDEFIPRGDFERDRTPPRPDLWTKYLPLQLTSVIPADSQLQINGGS